MCLGRKKLSKSHSSGATTIPVRVILHDGAEAVIQRWLATDLAASPKVHQELKGFFLQHGAKSVATCTGTFFIPV
jgi:hypothetical protein